MVLYFYLKPIDLKTKVFFHVPVFSQITCIVFSFCILLTDLLFKSDILVNLIKTIFYLDHVNAMKKLSGSQNRKRKVQQALKSRIIMESYLGKKSQIKNSEDKKNEDVKSDSKSESDSGSTPTTASFLCTNDTT